MKTKRRTQTVTITMAAAIADGTLQENTISFDRSYDRCLGVAAVEKTASAVFFELGVKSPRGTEKDLASGTLLISGTTVAPDDKFSSFGDAGIPVVDGELITVQLKNSSGAVTPAGGIAVQFIFLLERDETPN